MRSRGKANLIFAIDPGPEDSGFVVYDIANKTVVDAGHILNKDIEQLLISRKYNAEMYIVEGFCFYGNMGGKSQYYTCMMIGRCTGIIEHVLKQPLRVYLRPDVCESVSGNRGAKKDQMKVNLIELFGEMGNKKAPGPLGKLIGTEHHCFAALALVYRYMKE